MGSRCPSYEAAVASVRSMRRVRQFELGTHIGADWRVARAYLARMEREGIVGPLRPTGWRDVTGSAPPAAPARHEGPVEPRLEAVRRLIARELHPDSSPDDELARAVKETLFKRVWPRMEALLAESR